MLLLLVLGAPQTATVTGVVRDETGLPLTGATVGLKGTERFAVSDEGGMFSIANVTLPAGLIASLPGFTTREVRIAKPHTQPVSIVLRVAVLSETVDVRAPASVPDPNAPTLVTALDVVRTPGTQADLMRALGVIAGVSRIDEGAGLFVRGGDVSETRLLLDGVVVTHPYRYETPTGGFRGAIDPFLTEGAAFAMGAFSAAFANSLSAIIDMRVVGRPTDRQLNVTAGLAGVSGSFATPLGARSGLRLAANRATPSLLFAVNPSPQEFDELPGGWDATASITAESSRLGNIRVTALAQRDHVGVELEKDAFVGLLHSNTRHEFAAARWERAVLSRWVATASAGGDRYAKAMDVGVLAVDEQEANRSARFAVETSRTGWGVKLGTDGEVTDTKVIGRIPSRGGDLGGVSGSSEFRIAHRDWRAGMFTVVTRQIGVLNAEAGVRSDRFDAAGVATLDPRASARVRFGKSSAVRVAAGRYQQAVSPAYFDRVRGARTLRPMTASHLVIGYEHGTFDAPLFARIEAYRKRYSRLPLEHEKTGFSSDGYGHASGVDAFVRRTWPRLELSVSGSLSAARRRWTPAEQRDRYPLPPGDWSADFEIPFALHVIGSIPLTGSLTLAGSWRRAAGRPFTPALGGVETAGGFEPIWASINSDRLPHYERADVSISLLRPLGDHATAVFFASVDNLTGRKNVFEMAYSADYSARRPVKSAAPRAFYIGCSITH